MRQFMMSSTSQSSDPAQPASHPTLVDTGSSTSNLIDIAAPLSSPSASNTAFVTLMSSGSPAHRTHTKQTNHRPHSSVSRHPFAAESRAHSPSMSAIDLPVPQSKEKRRSKFSMSLKKRQWRTSATFTHQSVEEAQSSSPAPSQAVNVEMPQINNIASTVTVVAHSNTHANTHSRTSITADTKDPTFLSQQPNPFMTVSYFSVLFLHLLNPLLSLGRRKTLTVDDLWEPVPADRTEVVHARFEQCWRDEVEKWQQQKLAKTVADDSTPSMFHALRRAFGWRMYVMLGLEIGYYGFYATVPFSMRSLVNFIYAGPDGDCKIEGIDCGWWYSFSLGLAVLASSICINHKFYHAYRSGSQMRSALMTTIYAKSLRLSNSSRASSTTGETINLMSNDCSRVFDAVIFFNTLLVAPAVILVALALMINEIGVAAVAAVGLMLVIIPYQVWTANKTSSFRKVMLKFTDSRVKFISEILQGIRVIKLYEWTEPITAKIASMRAQELELLQPALLYKAINLGILFVYPVTVTFVTFIVYAYMGNEVIPSNVFIVMSFLTLIRFPVSLMPQAITFVSEARVGMQRLVRFLMLEELQSLTVKTAVSNNDSKLLPTGTIEVKNGEFRWSADNIVPILSNINFSIQSGELVGVIGAVGSGKSSLLAALLGEMESSPATATAVSGSISFMHQKPWIRNQTVESNILFGLPMDRPRYDQCVEAAALLPDFAIMPAGDQTEIGEQGLNMSGGQKQRISMARALYRSSMTDIYLCDDPFSAVDMHVGKHMFDRAIQTALKSKTRIVVLNSHLHFLEHFDKIIVIDRVESKSDSVGASTAGGKIIAIGNYNEISGQFPELLTALEENQAEEEHSSEDEQHVIFDPSQSALSPTKANCQVVPFRHFHQPSLSQMPPSQRIESSTQDVEDSMEHDNHFADHSRLEATAEVDENHNSVTVSKPLADLEHSTEKMREEAKPSRAASVRDVTANVPAASTTGAAPAGKLINAEVSAAGEIGLKTYVDYFRAAGVGFGLTVMVLILFSYTAGQVTRIMSDYWLVRWGADNNSPPASHGTDWWIGTWAAWIGAALTMALSRAWVYTKINIQSSKNLHNEMFTKLMHAPCNLYFDLTPAGRILNRFSKDLEQIDTLLPGFLHEFVLYAFQFVGTIILACVVTVYFIPIIAPIVIFFLWIQTFFRATSRELKRLEGTTRSPIFSSFSETLQGLSTIRAYGMANEFISENERLVDQNSKVFLMGYLAERWLSIRLEICSFLVVFAVALLTSGMRGTINPTLAGLTLIYALQMTGLLQWTVRLSIQTENTMTAVERLMAFTDLPQEAPFHTGVTQASWPEHGAILFNDAKLRYRPELDLVMKGITANIKPGEKIGICGRTGSGKSTLMVALFRLVELSSGSIMIDGVDISTVGLAELRSKLSIIPQDSVLFSGTVRQNLDPFNKHQDDTLWQALDRVGLSSAIKALQNQLDGVVSESGDNFSHGQKQLICIARALLRKTKILILDEASASIDPVSDRALQETIATNFKTCTILTIAHRLHTIIEYDRVMVLKDGLIGEFDRPSQLLQNKQSMFYAMVHEGGDMLVEQFIQLADMAERERAKEREATAIQTKMTKLKLELTAIQEGHSTNVAGDESSVSASPAANGTPPQQMTDTARRRAMKAWQIPEDSAV